jgi:hypothetical protein
VGGGGDNSKVSVKAICMHAHIKVSEDVTEGCRRKGSGGVVRDSGETARGAERPSLELA